MKLRPYQERAVDAIVAAYRANPKQRLLVVLPPGGGKTLIAAHAIIRILGRSKKRALAWAHRRELVCQLRDKLVASGLPAYRVGLVQSGESEDRDRPVQVASLATLARRYMVPADVIVSDEAHRDASDGRRALRSLYPNAFHIGFTATPERLDGRGLAEDYDDMLVVAQPSELIADGHLVAPKVYTVPPHLLPDVRGVRRVRGDYDVGALEKRVHKKALVGSIVDHWKRHADNRRTMVFAVSVKHSQTIAARFRNEGISAEHVDGNTPLAQRALMLDALERDIVQVITSCDVFAEGVDIPSVKCVVMARPTQSLALTIQQGGRCMRPWNAETALILDHAGNIMRHGFPHDDRAWDIHGRPSATSRGSIARGPCRTCETCLAVIHAAAVQCPWCCAMRPRVTVPDEVPAELVSFAESITDAAKRAELERLRDFAAERNFALGWAERVMLAKFGSAMQFAPPRTSEQRFA